MESSHTGVTAAGRVGGVRYRMDEWEKSNERADTIGGFAGMVILD